MADVELSTLGAVLKAAYEAEANTNAYTDAEKTKLGGIATGATANPNALDNLVEDTSPQLGGNLDLNGKAFVKIHTAALGHSFSDKDIGYITTEGIKKAQAGSLIPSTSKLVMAYGNINSEASGPFIYGGFVPDTGLTPGYPYYLSATAGQKTLVPPTGHDVVQRIVGFASAVNEFYFDPQQNITTTPTAQDVPSAVTDLVAVPSSAQVTLSWTEPYDGGATITDYLVEYKLASSGTWLEFAHTASPDNAIILDGLTNEELYDFRVSAINPVGTGAASNVAQGTPTAGNTLAGVIATGLTAFWDGKVYSGSGAWLNQISSPADGAAQADYNATPTNPSLHDTNRWVMDNTAFFSGASNPALMADMHKTEAGNQWTWFARVKTPPASLQMDSMIGTADANGDVGFVIRVDSGGTLKFDQYDGTSKVTKAGSTLLSADTIHNIAVSYDYDNDIIAFSVDGNTWEEITPAGLTGSITGAPTYAFNLASEGNDGSVVEAGAEIYTEILVNRKIYNTELANLNSWADTYYAAGPAAIPDQVTNLFASGGNGGLNLSWQAPADNGASITDYRVEYKLASASTWIEFSHAASAATSIQITGLTNEELYDTRVSAINAIGAGPSSATAQGTPTAIQTDPYDESPYKLTLPVDASGNLSGDAEEILQPALLTYESAWFERGDGIFRFKCPDGGATTATATYARCELRHLADIPWNTPTQDELEVRVTQIGAGEKTIIHQIHGIDPPWFKTIYKGGAGGTSSIYVLVKNLSGVTMDGVANGSDFPAITLKSNITDGEWTKLKVIWTGTAFQFYVDDVLVQTKVVNYTLAAAGATYYWKRGNYYQQADKSGDICIVEHRTNNNNFISL